MINRLLYLIYGLDGMSDQYAQTRLRIAALLYGVCRLRDNFKDKMPSPEQMKDELITRFRTLNVDEVLIDAVTKILEHIESADESVYYFVLWASRFITGTDLTKTLEERLVNEGLVIRYWSTNSILELAPNAKLTLVDDLPHVPWNLSPAMNDGLLYPPPEKKDIGFQPQNQPVDSRGYLAKDFVKLRNSERILGLNVQNLSLGRDSDDEFIGDEFHVINLKGFKDAFKNLYDGISSDTFQPNGDNLRLIENCEFPEVGWRISDTIMKLAGHVDNANELIYLLKEFSRRNSGEAIVACRIADSFVKQKDYLLSIINGIVDKMDCNTIDDDLCDIERHFDNFRLFAIFCLECLEKDLSLLQIADKLVVWRARAMDLAAKCAGSLIEDLNWRITLFLAFRFSNKKPPGDAIEDIFDINEKDRIVPNVWTVLPLETWELILRTDDVVRKLRNPSTIKENTSSMAIYSSAMAVPVVVDFMNEIVEKTGLTDLNGLLTEVCIRATPETLFSCVLQDFRDACEVISAVFLTSSRKGMSFSSYVDELKQLKTAGYTERHVNQIFVAESDWGRGLIYNPPFPLDLIIRGNHQQQRYAVLRIQLRNLRMAMDSMSALSGRDHNFPLGDDRRAFMQLASLQRFISSVLIYTTSVLERAWTTFMELIEKAECIEQLIKLHREFLEQVMLDTGLSTWSPLAKYMDKMTNLCIDFAARFKVGDARRCEQDFDEFCQFIELFSETFRKSKKLNPALSDFIHGLLWVSDEISETKADICISDVDTEYS